MSYARVLFIVYKVEYRNEVLGGRTYLINIIIWNTT